ncbi:MAG TPA: VWA domain-containing protein [Tepidisphaeraceae bacterium]|nr:VWA domain-containing protein [Tepidisphaeraceae bacterium]
MIERANSLPMPGLSGFAMVALEAKSFFLLAMLIVLVAAAFIVKHKPGLKTLSLVWLTIGSVLLALAAGGLTWRLSSTRQVAVMVDLSPSTRTAQYRNTDALHRRIKQLLGDTPYRLVAFADAEQSPLADGPTLPDLPANRTLFAPSDAPAVLLFSDIQFDLPTMAPPVYIAVDPLLEDPPDAAIRQLEIQGTTLSATVVNLSGQARGLTFSPSDSPKPQLAEAGITNHITPLPPAGTAVAARLSGSDPWPENDALAIRIPPPLLSQRWWVGQAPPVGDWTPFAPSRLPDGSAEYLAPSIIVLDNVAARDLSEHQQQRLGQYVRDLGGSIVLLGGDHAFAAGAYPGTLLETLSPLSSTPPTPTLHWIILGDSSGSMAVNSGSSSRWDQVTHAMLELLPHLPPEDPVSIGSFAENLRWWSTGKSARETAALSLPPADVRPNGPTNLEEALLRIIASSDASMPTELLLLTDADAQITKLESLRQGLIDKKIRLDLLALRGDGQALRQLEELTRATGGQSLRELTPGKWTDAVQKLYAQVAPDRLQSQAATVQYAPPLSHLPARSVSPWNRTWLKKNATALAAANTNEGPIPLAARWKVGSGEVLAAAFPASTAEAEAFAKLIAQPPKDPRFQVTWDTGPDLRVTIDALDGTTFLNGLALQLELSSAPPTAITSQQSPIPQTAPGRYQLSIASPRQPAFAAVRHAGRILDRTAVAGRYAPEFNTIGNNRVAMQELAHRTGGAVIPPSQTKPIDFHWPRRDVPLTSYLSALGALFLAAGFLHWRLR